MSVLQNIDKLISNSWFFPSGIAVVLSTLYIGYAPTSIGLGALGFFILWYRLRLDKNINFHFALVLPFLIYGLMLISYFWSIDQPLSLKGLGRLSNFVIIPAMFILMPRFDVKATNRVLMLFTYSNCAFAVVFLIIAVLRFIKSNDTAVFAYHELVSGLELNAIYVSIFFLSSYFYLLNKKGKSILDKVAVPFLAVVIILLSSKMALIILTLGTLIYFFGFKGWGFLRNLKILILVLASLVAVVFISRQMTNRFLEEKRSNIEEILKKKQFGRIYLWTGTTIRVFHLRLLKEQMEDDKIFWNGYGVFASRIDLKERHKKYDTYKGFHDYNYHNQYAQIMAELGIAGLLFLIGMLILMARSGIARSDYFTLVFALMMIFIFTSESFLWVQRGLVFFMIFYGLLARLDIAPKKTTFKAKNLLKS